MDMFHHDGQLTAPVMHHLQQCQSNTKKQTGGNNARGTATHSGQIDRDIMLTSRHDKMRVHPCGCKTHPHRPRKACIREIPTIRYHHATYEATTTQHTHYNLWSPATWRCAQIDHCKQMFTTLQDLCSNQVPWKEQRTAIMYLPSLPWGATYLLC